MKLFKTISILAVIIILLFAFCIPLFAADTAKTPNPLTDLTWVVVTAAVSALSGKFFSWLSARLTKSKYVPESVIVWLDKIKDEDIANAVTEARKLAGMTNPERIAWARKYLQDRYAQLPTSVANQMLETKIQEIIKTPQMVK